MVHVCLSDPFGDAVENGHGEAAEVHSDGVGYVGRGGLVCRHQGDERGQARRAGGVQSAGRSAFDRGDHGDEGQQPAAGQDGSRHGSGGVANHAGERSLPRGPRDQVAVPRPRQARARDVRGGAQQDAGSGHRSGHEGAEYDQERRRGGQGERGGGAGQGQEGCRGEGGARACREADPGEAGRGEALQRASGSGDQGRPAAHGAAGDQVHLRQAVGAVQYRGGAGHDDRREWPYQVPVQRRGDGSLRRSHLGQLLPVYGAGSAGDRQGRPAAVVQVRAAHGGSPRARSGACGVPGRG